MTARQEVSLSTDSDSATVSTRTDPVEGDLAGLCAFALDVLPTLRHPNGLYCFDRAIDSPALRAESVRYSLMVWLGLQSARSAGLPVLEDLDELFTRCLHHDDLTAGDLGLLLWCDSRRGLGDADALLGRLGAATSAIGSLDALAGMEIAWMLLGLAHQHRSRPLPAGAMATFGRIISHLRTKRATSSALFAHQGSRRHPRSLLPNFATEIYSVMALTAVAHAGLDDAAQGEATRLADALIGMQRADGGWPWLFDAARGTVVEPYEVYSVHQDAMAPMAMLALGELTGDDRYEAAARRGLTWCYGHNEMDVDFYDAGNRFAHRSIRRRAPGDRIALWANSAGSRLIGHTFLGDTERLELNATCRPYHLGWILEAWAGRAGPGSPP